MHKRFTKLLNPAMVKITEVNLSKHLQVIHFIQYTLLNILHSIPIISIRDIYTSYIIPNQARCLIIKSIMDGVINKV